MSVLGLSNKRLYINVFILDEPRLNLVWWLIHPFVVMAKNSPEFSYTVLFSCGY
jgi:hypothetical protein